MKKIILLFCLSFLNILGDGIPEDVKNNILKNSITKINRVEYKSDQIRAYKKIIFLKEKEKMSDEKFENKIHYLEKKYGTDYGTIYKNFSKDIEVKNEEKMLKKEKNKVYEKKYYEDKLENVPLNIQAYIDKKSKEKYRDDFEKRLEYKKNIEEFYKFIRKNKNF